MPLTREDKLGHKREWQRVYYAANRDKILEQDRARRAANKEKVLERRRACQAANRKKIAEQKRALRAANIEKAREQDRARYYANREKTLSKNRIWHAANQEKITAKQRIRRAANPAQHRKLNAHRRARQHTVEYEKIDYRLVYERDGGICRWCDRDVTFAEMHLDHKVPLSRGGAHTYENVCCSCKPCNLRKHNKLPEEFEPCGNQITA